VTAEARWSVEDLGNGCGLFRWRDGFYVCPFLVTREGVLCIDPVSAEAAAAYREAVRGVTDKPIRWVLYSHDHRDHIVGASVLAPEAEILAHRKTKERILYRGDTDIALPTRPIDDGAVLSLGDHTVIVRHFGPSHSRTNLCLILPTGSGRLLVFVDAVEPGFVPYRGLPDTDFRGLLRSLEAAERLEFDSVVGGHAGPGPRQWVAEYRLYFTHLQAAAEEALQAIGGLRPRPGEDDVALHERVRREVCAAATERLRERFGHWRGYDPWTPRAADRVLSYLLTGY